MITKNANFLVPRCAQLCYTKHYEYDLFTINKKICLASGVNFLDE